MPQPRPFRKSTCFESTFLSPSLHIDSLSLSPSLHIDSLSLSPSLSLSFPLFIFILMNIDFPFFSHYIDYDFPLSVSSLPFLSGSNSYFLLFKHLTCASLLLMLSYSQLRPKERERLEARKGKLLQLSSERKRERERELRRRPML